MPADLTKLSEANKVQFPSPGYQGNHRRQIEVETMAKTGHAGFGRRSQADVGFSGNPEFPPYLSKELATLIVRVRILALIESISTLQGK